MDGAKTESKDTEIKREKYWSELIDPERIERIRDVVKHLEIRLIRLERENGSLRKKMAQHQHIDGKVVEMKQISEYADELNYVGKSRVGVSEGKEYF